MFSMLAKKTHNILRLIQSTPPQFSINLCLSLNHKQTQHKFHAL